MTFGQKLLANVNKCRNAEYTNLQQ